MLQEKASIDEGQPVRRAALAEWQALQKAAIALEEERGILRRASSRAKAVNDALARADSRRDTARNLARVAGEARGAVVSRVFNDALNRIWHDLFIRLAPDEPFIPAFSVPDPSSGPMVAVLRTIHRSGERGGVPVPC